MSVRGIVCVIILAAVCLQSQPAAQENQRWFKGNLHTHTLWSDGDDYPEMVAEWYKTNGYHFLAISDHNILLEGEKWSPVRNTAKAKLAFEKYRARFGDKVQTRTNDKGETEVRLAGLDYIKDLFEESSRFLMIPSEEISASFEKLPVHINATNLRDFIKPRTGTSVYDVMQKNIDAVIEQRERTGQPMIPHLNHPNFHYAVTAEDLMKVEGERFFEVYNGHPAVHNEGDAAHPSTERMWDIILAWRLGVLEMEPMYGIAVDDTHSYHEMSPRNANAGRGWIMVRAEELTPESIIHAMEEGDFYASTGVVLEELNRERDRLSVQVKPEPGVNYTIQFIGTLENALEKDADGKPHVDPAHIGQLLYEEKGTAATYILKGHEMYVRAKVVSTQPKANTGVEGEVERAWTQPLIPSKYLHLDRERAARRQ